MEMTLQLPLTRYESQRLDGIRGKLAADNAPDYSDETLKRIFEHCCGRDIHLLAMKFRDAGFSLAMPDQPNL